MTFETDNAALTVVAADIALAERLFKELRDRSSDTRGVTRMSYGPGENIAHAIVRREAETLGLTVVTDAACNLYMTLPGQFDAPGIVIGSHLDSVPMGGNYDGAAGVLMGLSVLSGIVSAARIPSAPITVMAIRAEESAWFNASYIGSRAAFGRLSTSELENVTRAGDGMLLGQAIRDAGGDTEKVAAGQAYWQPAQIGIFLEPHIEQGPVLNREKTALGIVTGIRGSLRYRQACCRGTYAHSGTTPHEARNDAVRAVSNLVVDLDRLWQQYEDQGHDLTVTVGQFATDPDEASFSKVAGLVRFSLDIRSKSQTTLERIAADLMTRIGEIEQDVGVRFDLGAQTTSDAAQMHPGVIEGLKIAAKATGQRAREMPSGAGHDAATFASVGVPTGMLFLRSEYGSHNPDEHLAMADFAAGAALLLEFCLSPPNALA